MVYCNNLSITQKKNKDNVFVVIAFLTFFAIFQDDDVLVDVYINYCYC